MPPESAEKVLAALFACDAQFFKTLDEEKAVFKRANIVAHPYNLLDTGEPRTSVVPFSEPVEAYGLHLTGYAQQAVPGKSDYAWGFYASEQPDEVGRALETARSDTLGANPRDGAFAITASDSPDFPEHGLVAVLQALPALRTCLRFTTCSCLETSVRHSPTSSISSLRLR